MITAAILVGYFVVGMVVARLSFKPLINLLEADMDEPGLMLIPAVMAFLWPIGIAAAIAWFGVCKPFAWFVSGPIVAEAQRIETLQSDMRKWRDLANGSGAPKAERDMAWELDRFCRDRLADLRRSRW